LAPLGSRRICLTGAECTGKTTLASILGERYGGIVIPEFAREYAERVARELTYADVEPIARGQMELDDEVFGGRAGHGERRAEGAPDSGPFVSRSPLAATRSPSDDAGVAEIRIHDTDLISTVVYSRHHYGDCPAWIVGEARKRLSDLYLLLDIDVPWEADGVRDSGARREKLHREFLDTLRDFGARVVTISGGGWDERVERAISVLASWLA
jgi:nicotinamide riboside kinase